MKKLIFFVVMVLMTVITVNVYAQPVNQVPSQSASSEEPVVKKKTPRRFMFLELDSNDLRDMRIDSLRTLIIRTLDSIYETKNYYFIDRVKFFRTYGGEFKTREIYQGNTEFSGSCGCDYYIFDLRNVSWDRIGKKFKLKFGTVFYGDNINIVEPRFIQFLKNIRTPIEGKKEITIKK